MRWTPGARSKDLEDRRGGGMGRIPGGGRGLGLGTLVILVILSLVFKRDFVSLAGGLGGAGGVPTAQVDAAAPVADPAEEPMVLLMSAVLDSAQNMWEASAPRLGVPYRRTRLVLFRDAVQSACGFAQAATGPFYCPGDEKVYIDLGFFRELQDRFGAPGDFAQAYVLAHEVGHHLQNVLGTERQVRQLQQSRPELQNALSVRMELQADCYAGVWGHRAAQQGLLDQGDAEEGLRAAASVGDDRIARMSGAPVHPESFSHGSSEQRMEWFARGLRSGDPGACDSFQ